CRAISAAGFGDPDKVKYVPLTAQQRFTALQSGEVDILSNNTTWTLLRDTTLGLNFGPVVFYDGQGFLVPKKLNVKTAKELNGATICVQPGTTTELNLADYFRGNKMEFKPVVIENVDEMAKSDSPDIKRMLGATPGMGKALNLDEKWAYNAVKLVGNYGEIFDKHLGLGSPLKLERGYNNLWSKGGLIYAMPIR